MHRSLRVLLFTVCVGVFCTGTLLAQRGGAIGARAPLPSSTALGAGALSTFPSSTAAGSLPALGRPGFGTNRGGFGAPGFGGGGSHSGLRNYNGSYNHLRRPYRDLPYSYVVAPYYYPSFDWGGDYSAPPANPQYDSSAMGPDPAAESMLRNQAEMGQQLDRLSAQVNDLMAGQTNVPQPAASPAAQAPPQIPITVVLRSGGQLTVQNYAISGNTLWDFTGNGAARKIPLSNIDIPASSRATEANGGEFPQLDGSR